MTTTKKLTIATVKSFIRNNLGQLLIQVSYDYDGMADCVASTGSKGFVQILRSENGQTKYDLGLRGVWFVNGPRNYCRQIETATHRGFEVSNCCGCWTVAVAK